MTVGQNQAGCLGALVKRPDAELTEARHNVQPRANGQANFGTTHIAPEAICT